MKILMLTEYFKPFDFGGSEWSTFELAKGLSKKLEITIITPNYGNAASRENIDGVHVIRFPFYKKITDKKQLSPFWQTNLLWLIWTFIFTFFYSLKYNIDIIHIQGKYFLPAAFFTKLLTGKKIAITLRDYIILCPLGMCLMNQDQACDLRSFIRKDFQAYRQMYLGSRNRLVIVVFFFAALRAKFHSYLLKFLLKFVDKKISVSNLLNNIYQKSGVRQITTLYNPIQVHSSHSSMHKGKRVLYAGRLTPGKGPLAVVEAIPSVLRVYPDTKFEFYGDGFYKDKLKKLVKKLAIGKKVMFVDYINHTALQAKIKNASLVVIPSVWPEPFSRVGLETLANLTPLVITERTGNSEFFSNGRWGFIIKPTPAAIATALIRGIKDNNKLKINMKQDAKFLSQELWDKSLNSYEKIYKSILN